MATVGRPPKYKSVDEIEGLIDAYFEKCGKGEILYDKDGEIIYNQKTGDPARSEPKPPTVTGLALALGFTSRLALLNYEGKKEFVNTITRAKAFCEEYAESRLFDRDGVHGARFSLTNNFKGWRERPDDSPQTVNDGVLPAILEYLKKSE